MAVTFTEADLTVGENTLSTIAEADREAAIEGLSVWDGLTESDKVAALMRAYRKIAPLCFCLKVTPESYDPWINTGIEFAPCHDEHMEKHIRLEELTAAEITSLPSAFLSALTQAQMFEAADTEACDSEEAQRGDGIIMQTQGATTTMFRTGVPLKTPLCRAAMDVIGRYLCSEKRTGRA